VYITFSIKTSCTHNLCARKIVKERKLEKKRKKSQVGVRGTGGAVAPSDHVPNWFHALLSPLNMHPVRLAYQPPVSSTFLSEQTSHQQPANNIFLSEQISTSHQHQPNEQADGPHRHVDVPYRLGSCKSFLAYGKNLKCPSHS
jgi:hypothetical protein